MIVSQVASGITEPSWTTNWLTGYFCNHVIRVGDLIGQKIDRVGKLGIFSWPFNYLAYFHVILSLNLTYTQPMLVQKLHTTFGYAYHSCLFG